MIDVEVPVESQQKVQTQQSRVTVLDYNDLQWSKV